MRVDWWMKIWCPACSVVNWICAGDLNDLTVADTEGVECHSCHAKFALDPDTEEYHKQKDDECDEDEESSIYYELGQATPD